MKELDCCGLSCPIPVLNVKKALKDNPDGLIVKVDEKAAKENISRLVSAMGYKLDVSQDGDICVLTITK